MPSQHFDGLGLRIADGNLRTRFCACHGHGPRHSPSPQRGTGPMDQDMEMEGMTKNIMQVGYMCIYLCIYMGVYIITYKYLYLFICRYWVDSVADLDSQYNLGTNACLKN